MRKLCGARPGDQPRKAELFHPSLDFLPGKGRFPTQAKIQHQATLEVVIVLNVQAGESVSIVLEFSSALPKGWVAGEVSELSRQEIS